MYAGHGTRFLNLKAHAKNDPRVDCAYRSVTGWAEGGTIERLPLVPAALKGRARAVAEAVAFAAFPRPDAIWTAAATAVTPYLWSQTGRWRRPLVLDLDWTHEQQEALAPLYYGRPPKRGLRRAAAGLLERALWRGVTLFTPWSRWAADSLRRGGIHERRIRVIPPGVDLRLWTPRPRLFSDENGPLRLLFVGGDFQRKGGDILLEVFQTRLTGRCELDIVTRDHVDAPAGAWVHRAEANSSRLAELYASADLFVMPSLAECFGISTLEAMASGLPVVVSDAGAAREIVDEGGSGWLVQPTPEALARTLEGALARRSELQAMGLRGRAIVEARFDGRANDRAVIDAVLEAIEVFKGGER